MYYREVRSPTHIEMRLIDVATHIAGIAIERKRAEEAIKESEKLLRKVIDGLGPYMLVGLMTTDGTLIQANRPALELAGLKPEDVLGKLESIKNNEFIGEEKFLDVLKTTIGDEQTNRYKSILRNAWQGDVLFRHMPFVGVLGVLEDEDLLDNLRDEIGDNLVIVADVSTRGKDIGPVPLDEKPSPLSSIHANVLNSILTLNFIDDFKPWQQLLINLVLVVIICFAAIKTRALVFSGLTVLIFALFIAFVIWLFFYNNTLTNMLSPSLSIVFSFIFVNLYRYMREEQEKAFLFHTFESYFAPSVMNKILKNPERLESSERKFLSVLFSDISGFTSWCSTREPEEIHRTLNEYFSQMVRIVFKHEGTIDKYMGDGMLAFFGDPIEYDDHALRAVKVAIEMQQKARELKKQWEAQGRLQIQMRIGINTGEVVVGNMGSKSRMDYTVLGSNVNLAQRLEVNAPIEGILISEAVYNELKKEEEKDKNKVFTRFYRSEEGSGLETEGTGLGLFIVKSYIESLGGKVYYESKQGKGSKFTVEIPLKAKKKG